MSLGRIYPVIQHGDRAQALSEKQMKRCQKLVQKTNQDGVFIHDTPSTPYP